MYNLLIKIILVLVFTHATLVSAEQNESDMKLVDEVAVKAVINKFLIAAGNNDTDAMSTMFTANANIGGASLNSGKWNIFTMTLEEFLAAMKSNIDHKKYSEPVSKFTVFIEKGRLAFVKADATLIIEGEVRSYNFDYFTLLKENEVWKILNGSYVSVPVDK